MASKIKVNTVSDAGDNTIISSDGAGTVNITATSFTGDGSSLTGISSVGGATGVDFNDNVKARFGTGNDLQIYHDGTDSLIVDDGTGKIQVRSNGDNIEIASSKTSLEKMANFVCDGAIELYYDGALRLQTTTTGANFYNQGTTNVDLELITGAVNDRSCSIKFTSASGSNVRSKISCDHYNNQLRFFHNDQNNERMRIDSNGDIFFKNTTETAINSGTTDAKMIDNYDGARLRSARSSTSTREHIIFYNPNGDVGDISTSGTSTSYNTSSDYRLKENVIDLADAITRVKQLQPKRFNFIADANASVDGFLAHEVSSVVPEAITGTKDEVEVWKEGEELPEGVLVGDNKLDDEGNTIPKYQGIDQSKLVPLLTASLKEAIAKIEELETRLATLENA